MNKTIITYLIFAFTNLFYCQQNLVPNGSFEDTTYCVSGPAQMLATSGWSSYADSPDYFNTCSSNPNVSVPYNWGGYQQPASGNAYCGLGTYSSLFGQSNVREFIGRALSTQLTIGTKYYVSFKVNLSLSNTTWANCATNNLGVGFSSIPYNYSTNPLLVTNNPKVYSNNIISDTLNWTTIFGSFIADSAYQYIMFGNLFNNSNTDTLIVDASASPYSNCFSYYFVDDICVSNDSTYTANYIYTGIDKGQINTNFNIFPNPIKDFIQIKQSSKKPYDLIIYNSLGQLLYEEKNIVAINKIIVATAFNNGLLFISINSNNQRSQYKLLKQ